MILRIQIHMHVCAGTEDSLTERAYNLHEFKRHTDTGSVLQQTRLLVWI